MPFLPMSDAELSAWGWDCVDFVFVSGDAYVDHPAFGSAVISRVLVNAGYRVGILAQPDWRSPADFRQFGRPHLGFLISSGCMDSMVSHYTTAKKPRSSDAYSPGGRRGCRPDRAAIVYAQRAREAYKNTPIIVGGIEASLRRLAHYDYWDDKVRRSLLLDAKADLLVYGMGESSILEIAAALQQGMAADAITHVRGTVFRSSAPDNHFSPRWLPRFSETAADKQAYAEGFRVQIENADAQQGNRLIEDYGDFAVIQNPPALPLSQDQMDAIYGLPYMRRWHPSYEGAGGIPALEEVRFSLTSHRGCFGGCSFCALNFHQGRVIQSRSHESLLAEAHLFTEDPAFKGYIHDVGGPTANFRVPACRKQRKQGACRRRQCLTPKPCRHLDVDHTDYLTLLRKLRRLSGVKKVFIRSGIRFDYLLQDADQSFIEELCEHHVSGQLKVAPEHAAPQVLACMGKPPRHVYERFAGRFGATNARLKKRQYLVPYFMSGHPGAGLSEAIELALFIKQTGQVPEQVQDFYPTPGTLSTCMYYTGIDPRDMTPVLTAKRPRDKAMQRALMQYSHPKNYELVREALTLGGREDLIGRGPQCLIPPTPPRPRRRKHRGSS